MTNRKNTDTHPAQPDALAVERRFSGRDFVLITLGYSLHAVFASLLMLALR